MRVVDIILLLLSDRDGIDWSSGISGKIHRTSGHWPDDRPRHHRRPCGRAPPAEGLGALAGLSPSCWRLANWWRPGGH